MAWAQEIIDFILKLKPWTTVEEYQTGLRLWWGKCREYRIPEDKLIEILDRKKASQRTDRVKLDDKIKYLGIDELRQLEVEANKIYRKTKTIPPGWHVYDGTLHLGRKRLEHPERYSKNLPYGTYAHPPEALDICRVVALPAREVVKDLKFISTLVKLGPNSLSKNHNDFVIGENKNIKPKIYSLNDISDISIFERLGYIPLFISGFVKYEIEDGYKAFTGVQDWDRSYHSKVLMTMSENVRGTNIENWPQKNFVDDIESKIKSSLNGMVREKWGIWTSDVGITDAVPHGLVRNVQELYVPDEGMRFNISGS